MRRIELLAPARDLETGRQAILHGADAVYIGGPGFGARQAAGNSIEDIAALCQFAKPYGVRIYVTVNTLIYEEELREVESLTHSLYQCGVSALIVQDLALLRLDCPLPLHASTQMDNRSPEKARLLQRLGYEQMVLARELSLDEIRAIHAAAPDISLEAFVHGALCVSYSGRCQASQHCFQRSANRGQCAQFCRLAFDLVDADGRVLEHDRNLLSLRDMNRSGSLEEMIDAGVSSFKIEGRLKDVAYVKNVTAYYRRELDKILSRRPDLERSSQGEHTYKFVPQPERSFNRGFTEYFLRGRVGDEYCHYTPKAIGEPVGKVRKTGVSAGLGGNGRIEIQLLPGVILSNGDGLCFFDADKHLQGFRVNRAEGPCVYLNGPLPAGLTPSCSLYRNQDAALDALLSKPSAERRLPLDIVLTDDILEQEYELARTPQEDNIRQQMSRLGDTPYYLRSLDIRFSQNWFIPSSHLAAMRRKIVGMALSPRQSLSPSEPPSVLRHPSRPLSGSATSPLLGKGFALRAREGDITFERLASSPARVSSERLGRGPEMGGGLSNSLAREVASALGLSMPVACEVGTNDEPLMRCRYCLRYALGQCPRERGQRPSWNEPLSLRLSDGRVFPLTFDCKRCEMLVWPS